MILRRLFSSQNLLAHKFVLMHRKQNLERKFFKMNTVYVHISLFCKIEEISISEK